MLRRLAAFGLLITVGGSGVWAQQTTGDVTKIKGFKVPSYNEEGEMTSMLYGEYAQIMPDGMIQIEGLNVEFFRNREGEKSTDMNVTAPNCFFSRDRGMAVSDDDVRIARESMVVTGKGFVWDNNRERLVIMDEAKVVLKNARPDRRSEGDGEGSEP